MALTFADTHNMIAYLTKSDASEGFEQIIDFLNASLIQYALTVTPNIYVSCMKQFWSSVLVKKTNDVSIDCLPNEEIFTELARMGYEKPSTKLTFYKAFFSAQWKKFNFLRYIFDSLVRNVDSSSKFYMYPRFLQLIIHTQVGDLSSYTTKYSFLALTQKVFANMRRVGKGFSGVETPLFERMFVQQQAADDTTNIAADEVIVDDVADVVAHVAAKSTQPLPTPTTTPSPPQDLPSTSHEVNVAKDVEVAEDADVQGRLEESQAQVYHIDLEHADKVLSMQDDETEPAELQEVIEVVTIAKLMTEVVTAATTTITAASIAAAIITAAPSAARRRKWVVIRDPEETATPSTIIHSDPKSKDKGKGIMVQEPKPLKKQAQIEQDKAYAREKPQTEAHARKNMIVYLKNMAGFKMDYFKGMSYDDTRPIFEKYFNSNVAFLEKTKEQLEEEASRALKRTSESQEEKADKKQNLDEEVEELKKHLQIIPNDDDDVYTEAIPLALKIVQDRFASSKPKNFSDDFLLTTLKSMFEKPDVEAQVWKNQKGIHERRYLMTRFTLDQMLNNVRLEVEEESKVSLELLRFVRRQQQEGYRPELQRYTLRDYYCWLKTYCCWYKLMLLVNAADSRFRVLEQSAATVQIVSAVQIVKTVNIRVTTVMYKLILLVSTA
nr:hypothetical protein [Tanacetum cinerariifolium]